MNDENLSHFNIGDHGKTLTNLRPEGKAIFANDERVTVYSLADFIEKDTAVEIVKKEHNKIFVKPIK